MTPEQRSRNASNARTAREKTLLREVARLGALILKMEGQIKATEGVADLALAQRGTAIDEVAILHRKNTDLTMERDKHIYLAAAWRDEAMHQQTRLAEERAKLIRLEQDELPF